MKNKVEEDINPEIFGFDKRDVERYMIRELGLKKKFAKCFNYVHTSLSALNKPCKIPKDLEKLNWYKGKSYDWVSISDNNTFLVIRKYNTHFTIFFKNIPTKGDDYDIRYGTKYGCFEFHTNTEHLSGDESDSYVDDNFKDINKYLKPIITLIKDDLAHAVWNSYSLKLKNEKQRPNHIEVKSVWDGDDTIISIDKFIFACDELFHRYLEIFAQTEMLNHLKTLKKGDKIGSYTITKIKTDVKKDYFHDAGLEMKDDRGDIKWQDVYGLTMFYYEDVFPVQAQTK